MIRLGILILLFNGLTVQILQAQADPCDPPLVASISISGPVCSGEAVTITFNLPDDDDDEGFDVTYSVGGNTFFLTAIVNGHTEQHIVTASTTATLSLVTNNDDDDDDCFTVFSQTIPITVSDPVLTITNQTDPDCDQDNGSITAAASNGITPYQYSLNGGPPQPSGAFMGLGAGNYEIVVQDAAGCTASISTTLTSPGAPTLAISNQTNPGCGQSNGSITAATSGGTSPYQYSLNGGNFQSSGTFSGLGTGNYTVVTQDAAGCTASVFTTLTSPNAPTLTITNQTNPGCGQSNGSITAAASGGTSPYQYSLNGGNFQSSGTFSGLNAGSYTVVTQDAAGCTASVSTTLTSPGAPTLSITNQTNPGCGQSNGSITAAASGGVSPYQFSLGGTVYQTSPIFSGLAADDAYQVFVKDAANCIDIETIVLTDLGANLPQANISVNMTQGCITTVFSLTGNLPPGTTGIWSSDEAHPPTPANLVWTLGDLPPGNVTVVWTLSAPGCPNYDATTLVLEVLPPPEANNDGIFDVEQGEVGEATVLLNDVVPKPVKPRILKSPAQGTAFFNGQNTLEYQPGINANGADTVVYEICYIECPDVCDTALVLFRNLRDDDPCVITGDTSYVFTNGLTPNDDGNNDYLVFRAVRVEDCAINYAKSEIIIYNRWGDKVFEASPYNNNWGGKNGNGGDLPPGVYYFVLRITLDKVYSQFGSVILIR